MIFCRNFVLHTSTFRHFYLNSVPTVATWGQERLGKTFEFCYELQPRRAVDLGFDEFTGKIQNLRSSYILVVVSCRQFSFFEFPVFLTPPVTPLDPVTSDLGAMTETAGGSAQSELDQHVLCGRYEFLRDEGIDDYLQGLGKCSINLKYSTRLDLFWHRS